MTKRRYLSQLPAIHQTQTLQKFFSATVDQVFQPGETQSINAFVGRKPSYFDAVKDFYKPEINAERAFYQLEPAMTAKADSTVDEFSDLLFYQDLVNNLRFQGANVDKHDRLFESDQYSWCPPVNAHKLTNFSEYYWLPDGAPILVLTVPSTTHTGDGTTKSFAAPAEVSGLTINVVVKVNGAARSATYNATTRMVTLSGTAPAAGATVVVWINGNFAQYIEGQSSFTYPLPATAYAVQTQTVEYSNTTQQVVFDEQDVDTAPALERSMCVEIRDNNGSNILDVDRDTTGLLTLTPHVATASEFLRLNPLQTVVERGAASAWSSLNHWYHRNVLFFSNDNYQPIRASRPIVEFSKDLELASSHVYDADDVETHEPRFVLYSKSNAVLGTTKIFAYARGEGNADSVLGFPLLTNSFGNIQFQDLLSDSTGLRFFKLAGKLGTNWNAAGTSVQEKVGDYYEIPHNLQANPLNQNITDISANDWHEHFKPILSSQAKVWFKTVSEVDRSAGRKIMQSRSSLLRTMLMNSNASLDFMKAVAYSEREYLRYRGKFMQSLKNMAQQSSVADTDNVLTRLLTQLKSAKTLDFPFSNTGMGGGEWFIPPTAAYLGVTPLWELKTQPQQYIIEKNSKGVEILWIRGHDGSLTPGFSRSYVADNGATVPIEWSTNFDDRDKVLIAFEKKIYDSALAALKPNAATTTRVRPTFDIQAITPAKFRATDYTRDEFLTIARPMFERWVATSGLNYRENKIYDDANAFTWNYRGLKDRDGQEVPGHWRGIYKWFFDTDRPHQSPWEMLGYVNHPGTWWNTTYSWTNPTQRAQLVKAVSLGLTVDPATLPAELQAYLVGDNPVEDYPTGFPAMDSGVKATMNAFLLAIAPYCDKAFARRVYSYTVSAGATVLTGDILPVDALGNLLDPITAGVVIDEGITNRKAEWEFGDCGPVENSWWNNHNTSFTWAQIGYLMKPARFVESNWATLDEQFVNGQWLRASTGDRSISTTALVHNELGTNGLPVRVLGIQTWLSDFIRSQGQDVTTTLGARVRTLQANLAHKLGGFIDPSSLKTFTEHTGILPQEDVLVALYRSPSVREEFYGGVITEWTGRGWRVIGYDIVDPAFKILPVKTTGRRTVVSLNSNVDASSDWRPSTYYQVGTLIRYANTNYRCLKTHTSADKFEQVFWAAESVGNQSPADRATWYFDHDTEVQRVPYGTEFHSRQDLVDFLSGYQAYLESRGWSFDQYDAEINQTKDFRYSVLEFLFWAQGNWTAGAFMTLSPSAQGVKFKSDHGTVQNVEQLVNGVYSIVDRAGTAISKNVVTTNRLDDEITVGVTQGGIFGLRLFVSEVEQALVFKNRTIFNDVIYDPLFDLRQQRIRILANISQEWKGRLDAPGFVITDNRLIPSFEQQVEDLRHMYDIEKAINLPLRDNARHQVGYQSRSYLENLMYNEVNQFEFYQGMIQQKGAPGVYGKLLRNNSLTQNQSLAFLEEWAFRKGVYGGVDAETSFEFLLAKGALRQDPQLIINNPESTAADAQDDKVINLGSRDTDTRWVTPVTTMFPSQGTFNREKGFLPNAGYVRLNETDYQALTFDQLATNVASATVEPEVSDRIWVYDVGSSHTWNVFQVTDITSSGSAVQAITNTGEGLVLTFASTLKTEVGVGDWIYLNKVVNDFAEISGFYQITDFDSTTITIDAATLADEKIYTADEDKPSAFLLSSRRASLKANNKTVVAQTSIASGSTAYNAICSALGTTSFVAGELVYVDVCYEHAFQDALLPTERRWAVFTFNSTGFTRTRKQPAMVKSGAVRDIKIFDTNAIRTSRSLNAKPLLNGNIVVWDPVQGIVPGEAQKEISYKLDNDPAQYNAGALMNEGNGVNWGQEEVGRLWWNLSTTRYLVATTDDLTTEDESDYRQAQWGKLAPGASVDIYEWVKSSVSPAEWQEKFLANADPQKYDGAVLNADNPSYVESTEWDARLSREVPVYFFWVKNRRNTPNTAFRRIDAYTVSQMLTNPTGQGLAWMAPLAENSMILSGAAQFLTETSSVQFSVKKLFSETKKHVEWQIMRAGDGRSLPDETLWGKVVTSLTAKDVWGKVLPSEERFHTDRIGYDVERGQNMFKDVRAARKHTVQFLNSLFASVPFVDERRDPEVLNTTEFEDLKLVWAQKEGSYYVKPIPHHSYWDTSSNREPKPWPPLGGSAPNQLVYGLKKSDAFWSVLGYDYWKDSTKLVEIWETATTPWDVWNTNPWEALDNTLTWQNSDADFRLLLAFHVAVQTVDDLENAELALAFPEEGHAGLRVLVRDTLGSGFWSVWECHRTNGVNDIRLMQMQRYDTSDCWSYVDWYADGYGPTDEPSYVFETAADRDAALGVESPSATFVKLNNAGNWVWTEYLDGEWVVVGKKQATIAFNEDLWSTTNTDLTLFDPDRDAPTLMGKTPAELAALDIKTLVEQRDRGYELNFMLNALRQFLLTDLEINQLFFSLINYVHTEQDFVDWCFKTSFMYVSGYSDNLRQDPVAFADLTGNLLEYINEVKPYHVKVRDFIAKYRTTDEKANVRATDFDFAAYLDVNGTIRVLDPNNPEDQEILSQGKWAAWWNQYQAYKNGVVPIENTKFRKMKITIGGRVVENDADVYLNGSDTVEALDITANDENARVRVAETIRININRSTDQALVFNGYDVGDVKTLTMAQRMQFNGTGNIYDAFDLTKLEGKELDETLDYFETLATNWDVAEYDEQGVDATDQYALRSLVVSPVNYTGKPVASLYDLIEFWDCPLPGVTWDQASDTYSPGADIASWFDAAVDDFSLDNWGMMLESPRVIAVRLIDNTFSDQTVLHVFYDKTANYYKSHEVYRLNMTSSTATQMAGTENRMVMTSSAAPLFRPL